MTICWNILLELLEHSAFFVPACSSMFQQKTGVLEHI